jgi:hypothetical protein
MTDHTTRIAELNDLCRLGLDRTARIVITATCLAALTEAEGREAEIHAQAEVLGAVRRYAFAPQDGPERARGELILRGRTIRFTIDYYDRALEWGSENPADPSVTTRVMTIMLPGDD